MDWPNALRALKHRNYRVWMLGNVVSNLGTWMQRAAQDWLVLVQLTHHAASALGGVMALQFAPQLLLLPIAGPIADRVDKRRLLLLTQLVMAALSFLLGAMTLAGVVRLWEVDVLALLAGCAAALDGPARQAFVAELVADHDLANAVALNGIVFNAGRMVGPALAGLCIAGLGTGWAFIINGASFLATLGSLLLIRQCMDGGIDGKRRGRGSFLEGLTYVAQRPELAAMLVMVLLIGTFGLNFAIYTSTMAISVLHVTPRTYGVLVSMTALGSLLGGVVVAHGGPPRFSRVTAGAAAFGIACTAAAAAPNVLLFGATLVCVGLCAMTFLNGANTLIQVTTEPAMRGRVAALRLAVMMGGTPVGAPIVGWIADRCGPRWALGVGAVAGLAATLVGLRHVRRRTGTLAATHVSGAAVSAQASALPGRKACGGER